MTPRGRVETVLRGEEPDRTPFTIYQQMLPPGEVERRLRSEGLCIVKVLPAFRTLTPNVRVSSVRFEVDGRELVRTSYLTPHGELAILEQPAGFTSWCLERLFRGPEDYRRLRSLVNDRVLVPDYAEIGRAMQQYGGDGIVRADIGLTPLQEIMTHWMGLEAFAVEWAERRDEVLALYDAMVARQREAWGIIARSPVAISNYGGNEIPEAFGRERFERYVVPLYDGAAEVLHRGGKLLGAHLDGNNRSWADLVGRSALDYVEAFTPEPGSDMSVAEALAAWPGKRLWVNFPSSVHLAPVPVIELTARRIIRQGRPGDRLILGITEDMPADRWQRNLLAISRAIAEPAGG